MESILLEITQAEHKNKYMGHHAHEHFGSDVSAIPHPNMKAFAKHLPVLGKCRIIIFFKMM